MLVDFNLGHHDTVYSIVSMMICDFLANDMASFRDITPLTHNLHFFLMGHKVSARIMNLSVLKPKISVRLKYDELPNRI